MLSLQVQSAKSLCKLLSDDDKHDLVEELLDDLGILAWSNNSYKHRLLKSIVRMESARYITKKDVDRMSQLIQVFVKQSKGSSYDPGVERGKLIIYSPSALSMNNNEGPINIQDNIDLCLLHYSPFNVRIMGEIDGKHTIINMSHLVHHYSDNIEILTKFGYDLTGVLPSDD